MTKYGTIMMTRDWEEAQRMTRDNGWKLVTVVEERGGYTAYYLQSVR